MFNERDRSRERKHQICNRNRAFAQRNNSRRPIADVLEVKLENYVKATFDHAGDSEIHRTLIAFSAFQTRIGDIS